MLPKTNDATLAASAVDRNETASAFETGRGVAPAAPIDLSFLASAQQPDEIGRIGNYRVLAVLGHGGMGLVLRAEDPALRRQVAIKVMLPRFASDLHARARFIREAQAQAAVEHDHIVPIFGVNDGEPPFIVMPLLKGMTLADALKANAKPPLPAILRIGREIAEGLAAAHESGLIHRDIKPANIWLEGSRLRVRILDFGLARAAEAADPAATGAEPLTADGAVVGTPMYMSPEQAKGEHLDARTDLFSLGVILYQMVTGELPFHGRTTASVLLAVVSHEPKGLEAAAIPPAFKAIIERLLTKDRDAAGRPAAAAVVAYELGDIERGLTMPAVQVVALDSVPMAAPVANPFEVLDTTAADAEPVAMPVHRKKPVSKAWVFGGIAALLAVVVAAGVMFKAMTKTDPPVVKEEEPPSPPKPTPKSSSNSDHRKAIEAFLELGGTVGIASPAGPKYFKAGDAVPVRPIAIYEIGLVDVPMDDAKLDTIRALPPIMHAVRINAGGLTGAQFAKLCAFPNLRQVKVFNLTNNPIDGDAFAALKNCPDVTWLDLALTRMDDAGLLHLKDLKLEWINLHGCQGITDAGLERLAEHPMLTHLWLHLTGTSPRGAEKLAKLSKLSYLHPGKVDDATVDAILVLPALKELHLVGTAIAGRHLPRLATHPKIQTLSLSSTEIADVDLAALASFPKLTMLYLHGCKGVTEAGFEHLARCSKLTTLDLTKLKLAKPALDALSEKLPNCKIEYDGGILGPRDPNRPAAEKLRAHNFRLRIGTSDGKERDLKPIDPLPDGPFDVLSVTPPNNGPLPEDFVRTVLLPAIASLPKLQYISDQWSVISWTEADLAKLADSPVAANLLGVRGALMLTPGAIAELKRIPNLGDLGCLVGPGVAVPSLKELPNLSWLVLWAPLGTTHRLSAAEWDAIAGLKLGALELFNITIDATDARKLAAMKPLGELPHLTFGVCPGAVDHLSEFQSSTGFRSMMFRGPLSDPDLVKFEALRELLSLTLRPENATLTKAAVEQLAERLPQCKITWNGATFGPKVLPKK